MRRSVCILFGILFLIVISTAGTWAAEKFSIYDIPTDQSAVASKYWTVERMKAAIPRPTPKLNANEERSFRGIIEESTGTPSYDPSYDPGSRRGRDSALIGDGADTLTAATLDAANGYEYPPPHTTAYVLKSLYGTTSAPFPYKTIGKVFFTADDGKDYGCSGASIGGRAVLTAGHCVSNEKGTYFTNWVFIPSYQNATAPCGQWTASSFLTFASYHQGGDMARDVAFAVVLDQGGKKLSQKVGNLGCVYNLSRVQHWSMFGYPRKSPWNGKYMVNTEASYASVDARKSPQTTGIGTTQLGGCSGGPWIKNFTPGSAAAGTNYANGVNSYSLGTKDYEIYSPYFDSEVRALKKLAVEK
jgi:hypothetical protein